MEKELTAKKSLLAQVCVSFFIPAVFGVKPKALLSQRVQLVAFYLFKVEQQKDTLSSLETTKSKLEQELQELKERQDEILTENNAMTEHLETLKSLHAEEKVKLVSTSAQQSKLIDFLQSKAESKTSKWKVRDEVMVMMVTVL